MASSGKNIDLFGNVNTEHACQLVPNIIFILAKLLELAHPTALLFLDLIATSSLAFPHPRRVRSILYQF